MELQTNSSVRIPSSLVALKFIFTVHKYCPPVINTSSDCKLIYRKSCPRGRGSIHLLFLYSPLNNLFVFKLWQISVYLRLTVGNLIKSVAVYWHTCLLTVLLHLLHLIWQHQWNLHSQSYSSLTWRVLYPRPQHKIPQLPRPGVALLQTRPVVPSVSVLGLGTQ